MRGRDERYDGLFSYVDLASRFRRIIRCGRSGF